MAVKALDDNFVIGNIYAPNTQRDQIVFLEDLFQVLNSIGASSDRKLFWVGVGILFKM